MGINHQQIKRALVQIAERLGRPHYQHCVYLDLVDAIQNDTYHHLKEAVLSETVILDTVHPVSLDDRIEKIRAFCQPRGMLEKLARHAEVHPATIWRILSNDNPLSDITWNKIKESFDSAQSEFDREVQGLKPYPRKYNKGQ